MRLALAWLAAVVFLASINLGVDAVVAATFARVASAW